VREKKKKEKKKKKTISRSPATNVSFDAQFDTR
jgi:hypothetical protein